MASNRLGLLKSHMIFNALVSNSTIGTIAGLPLSNGAAFNMQPPYAYAYSVPTFSGNGAQGVIYYW